MTAGRIVYMDESYLWTPEAPCPFTQEQLMTQDQSARLHTGSLPPTAPTPALPGVAEALDRLDYARSELTARVHQLIEHIQPVVQPSDSLPSQPVDPIERPISPLASQINAHADAFMLLARILDDTNSRVDV